MRARAFTIFGALFCGAGLAIAHTVPIIFFHGGAPDELNPQQWLITPEAKSVLHRVVEEYKAYGDRYVLIVGHDENASTAALSYERSKRRAEATRDALISLGIPAAALATKPCSFGDPMGSPTGPEPMNRRVTFTGAATLQELLEADRSACPDIRAPGRPAR